MKYYTPPKYTPLPSPIPRLSENRYSEHHETTTTETLHVSYPTPTACIEIPFVVPGNYWYDRNINSIGREDKTVATYCEIYGAPQKIYYGSLFRPRFAIFDDKKFVKMVTANIGLTETNGRVTYSFNTTVGNAGCNSVPISLKINGFDNGYTDCFQETSTSTYFDAGKDYEIMNATNFNSIIWTENTPGIYLFEARVLDPDYSFCELKTYFAIEVVGGSRTDLWQALIIIGFHVVGVLVLAVSYTWYSNKMKTSTVEIQPNKKTE
jgi:hypothetical protein